MRSAYVILAVRRVLDQGGKVVLVRNQHVAAVLCKLERERVLKEPL